MRTTPSRDEIPHHVLIHFDLIRLRIIAEIIRVHCTNRYCCHNFQNECIELTTNILFVNVLNLNKAGLTIIILNSTRTKLKWKKNFLFDENRKQ